MATNITPAQFATATFSAGPNSGVTEIAVVAFDDLGNSSVAGDIDVTVTAPPTSPQPIVPTDHTPPTIVAPSQPLVTGVGSNPDLTPTYLQVTDANTANYTPSQLTYTIVSAPGHGYLLKGGSIVSSFTQYDINNHLIEYQENGTISPSDSFTYYVSDPAGNRTANTTFNITINTPPSSTTPTLDTDVALSVGQGQTAVITANNLHVTDSGLNPWQVIYTVTGGAANGQILADSVNVVHSFTQQQVDLGLISYQNTTNTSGPDNFTFTVSDYSGGAIGSTVFNINVIPQNNLRVLIDRPLYNDPGEAVVTPPPGFYIPGDVSLLNPAILTATDPGVDAANITYTITSMPAGTYFLIGQFSSGISFTGYSSFSGYSFNQNDINAGHPHSFTQAELASGQVYFRNLTGPTTYGTEYPITFNVADNAGNTVSALTLPLVIEPSGELSAGQYTPVGNIAQTYFSAPIGQSTPLGSGLLTYVTPQVPSSQAIYNLFYVPSHGAVLLDGSALAVGATVTQQEIDDGRLSYSQNGSLVSSDQFGFMLYDPFHSSGSPVYVNVSTTGTNGGITETGQPGSEAIITHPGNNYFFGDGSTTVDYSNAPNGVSIDLANGTASNGYGGTDYLTNIHSAIGSSYNDRFTLGPGDDSATGGAGADTFVYGSNGGADTITDFIRPDGDRIDLTGIGTVHYLSNVLAHTSQIGPDSVIDFGGGNSITLQNVNKGTLTPGDFVFSRAPAADDFSGNFTSDVLWRNTSTGQVGYWQMASNGSYSWVSEGTVSDPAWKVLGIGDFNGDGDSDVLWRNDTTGQVGYWQMASNGSHSWVPEGTFSDPAWKTLGIGDFNDDGNADVLWRSDTTGQVGYWQMASNGSHSWVNEGTVSDPAWKTLGIGDFNGDGNSDVLWRNDTTGQVGYWQMGSNGSHSWVSEGTVSDPAWKTLGIGDFNDDGNSDVLWRNSTTGQVGYWQMTSNGSYSWVNEGTVSDPAWKVLGVGDFNGDGNSDVLWRNATTGQVGYWQMASNGSHNWVSEGTVSDPAWHLA